MKKLIFSAPLFSLLLSGCAYYQPLGISSTSIGSQYERPSGMATGKARRWSFFPCYELCPLGDDSILTAVNNALDGKVGETLANVFAERKTVIYPFAFLPLIMRTDVVVTGTVVKYNSKEFAPDREFVYSGTPGEIWAQLLSFSKGERAQYIRQMPDRTRSRVIDFALDKENAQRIETGSKDSEVFEILLMRKPKTYTPKSALKTEAAINLNDCNSYDCIITLSPEKQTEAFKLVDSSDNKLVRVLLVNSAQRRIKACYPDKTPSVVTSPEVQLIYNEEAFLETLCKSGVLAR